MRFILMRRGKQVLPVIPLIGFIAWSHTNPWWDYRLMVAVGCLLGLIANTWSISRAYTRHLTESMNLAEFTYNQQLTGWLWVYYLCSATAAIVTDVSILSQIRLTFFAILAAQPMLWPLIRIEYEIGRAYAHMYPKGHHKTSYPLRRDILTAAFFLVCAIIGLGLFKWLGWQALAALPIVSLVALIAYTGLRQYKLVR